jgi:hypothetical protein
LTNGTNYGVKVSGALDDAAFRSQYPKGSAAPFTLEEVNWNQSGAAQNTEAVNDGVLRFARPEDGEWDPNNPNDFYFVTTSGGPGRGGRGGGLWRLRFINRDQPLNGGSLTLLLDGTEGMDMPDNMAVDSNGNLLFQEDPGNNAIVARIFAYRIATGQLATVAQFNPALFAPGGGNFTTDEESSGIIDAGALIGPGWYLLDAQVHTSRGLPPDPQPPATGMPGDSDPDNPGTVDEYVENGQLLAMRVTNFDAVYANGVPAPVIPEAPVSVLLPLIALAIGGVWIVRRRAPNGTPA